MSTYYYYVAIKRCFFNYYLPTAQNKHKKITKTKNQTSLQKNQYLNNNK